MILCESDVALIIICHLNSFEICYICSIVVIIEPSFFLKGGLHLLHSISRNTNLSIKSFPWYSSEKTFINVYARIWGVQEWGYAYCKTTTCKSCASFGILHWKGWTNANLRVHAKQKLGLLPLWSDIFPAFNYSNWEYVKGNFILAFASLHRRP